MNDRPALVLEYGHTAGVVRVIQFKVAYFATYI